MKRLRPRVSISFEGEQTLAQQQFKDECDINRIMDRYLQTGFVNHLNVHGARYGEMPNKADFKQAMDVIAESNSMFEELPARARRYFKEDPANFLDFIENEGADAVAAKFAELGLMREGYRYVPPEPENALDGSTEPPTATIDHDGQTDD